MAHLTRDACKYNNARAIWLLDSETKLQVYYKSRFVGVINTQTRTFHKKLDHSSHFFRMYKGWGISEDVLNLCHLYAIEKVNILTGNGTYQFHITDFYKGFVYLNPDDIEDRQRIVTTDASAIEKDIHKFKIEPFKPLESLQVENE